ncbi:MAG: hypothetical protein AAF798_04470 [Bacteroidota bacterium]
MKKILILSLLLFAGVSVTFGQEAAPTLKQHTSKTKMTTAKSVEKSIARLTETISSVDPELAPTELQQEQLKRYYMQKHDGKRYQKLKKEEDVQQQTKSKAIRLGDILTTEQMAALKAAKKGAKPTRIRPKE